jgi:hypothetical protein
MRFSSIILALALSAVGCVKKQSSSPIPSIEYFDFQAAKINGIDTAVMIISYSDGDGDIFRESPINGPNIIGTFYYLNSSTKEFTAIKDIITNDTARITQTVVKPRDVIYKGKSVSGRIYLPWSPFRSGDSVKVFKYNLFVVDEAGHQSNLIQTPTFTINF